MKLSSQGLSIKIIWIHKNAGFGIPLHWGIKISTTFLKLITNFPDTFSWNTLMKKLVCDSLNITDCLTGCFWYSFKNVWMVLTILCFFLEVFHRVHKKMLCLTIKVLSLESVRIYLERQIRPLYGICLLLKSLRNSMMPFRSC